MQNRNKGKHFFRTNQEFFMFFMGYEAFF